MYRQCVSAWQTNQNQSEDELMSNCDQGVHTLFPSNTTVWMDAALMDQDLIKPAI